MKKPHSIKVGENLKEHIHDIKSSLQSLVVANELAMESLGSQDSKKEFLISIMMKDLKKIESVIGEIEKDFCMEGKYES
tara:strand:+ start:7183 stop:7419 length:237 start_codon:yes stop_codon:yes gene_type:complete